MATTLYCSIFIPAAAATAFAVCDIELGADDDSRGDSDSVLAVIVATIHVQLSSFIWGQRRRCAPAI